MGIVIEALGASAFIGRSCFLVTFNNTFRVILDFGVHLTLKGADQFPQLDRSLDLNTIDAVVITHFHLDHVGALPYLMRRFTGPVFMTEPTAVCSPMIMEDFAEIMARKSARPLYTRDDMLKSMQRVTTVRFRETVHVRPGLSVTFYPAGHLLGAAMVHVQTTMGSAFYTGDFNVNVDRHLLPALPPFALRPDVLITESTFGTMIRDAQEYREQQFIQDTVRTLERGGRVLVPTHALGRAQDVCLLLDRYWDRMGLTYPIIATKGLLERATEVYKHFHSQHWMRPGLTSDHFNYRHIKLVDPSGTDLAAMKGPLVVLSSPSALNSGFTLRFFNAWCSDPNTLVVAPGYNMPGTITDKIISGEVKQVRVDKGDVVPIECTVKHLSFAAHADLKSIAVVAEALQPSSVVLVHGNATKMPQLKHILRSSLQLPVYIPSARQNTISIPVTSGYSGLLPYSAVAPLLEHLTEPGVGIEVRGPVAEGPTLVRGGAPIAQSVVGQVVLQCRVRSPKEVDDALRELYNGRVVRLVNTSFPVVFELDDAVSLLVDGESAVLEFDGTVEAVSLAGEVEQRVLGLAGGMAR
ncbi:Metallo-beta-lactamase superfamily [Carpediemonas membranifera]|uniref:Metallo-beta-lactamase superfamily n=1 Tax=Carpediemonas membranifera TaxID=201153 RepID=A0A8J6E3D0_9EUKA|nr:Metallo-beta-lactamase superfamily [Carpediemonas membranifera]|eukprot:KAG9395768.1 Metallo-beta-lactamase superfamily [Carpediemonas membranifera]